MGYSVFVLLTKKEEELVSGFLECLRDKGLIGVEDGLFGMYTSDPRTKDLSYTGRYSGRRYVGCDYGDFRLAHTFVNWMAKTLGKSRYVYDGDELFPVSNDMIIGGSRPQSRLQRRHTSRLLRMVRTLQKEWDAYINHTKT